MRKDWQISSVEEVVKFIDYRGKTPQKTEYGMRLITAKNVKMGYLQNKPMEFVDPKIYDEWMTRGIPKKGDVLFTTEAPLGNVAQLDTDEKVVFAQRIIVMQPKREVLDSTFLKYMLLSNVMQEKIHEKGTGATVKGIKSQLLKKVKIYFPRSLSEQKQIVAILDEAFEGIDRAIANTEKNLANARELFESYLNAIFTQKGDGWVEKKLEDICKEITVGHVGSMASKYKDSGIPFLRSQNILPFRIKLDNVVFIDNEFHSILKKSQLRPGDLAIVRTGYPGTAAVIPDELEIVNCSDLVIVKPGDNINPHYLCLFFNSVFGKTLVGSRLVGAAQKHFNITTAKKVLIPFPCLTEQNCLVTKIDELAIETQRLEAIYRQKIAALNELKQSILQKAFTGELTADTANQTTKAAKEGIAA